MTGDKSQIIDIYIYIVITREYISRYFLPEIKNECYYIGRILNGSECFPPPISNLGTALFINILQIRRTPLELSGKIKAV